MKKIILSLFTALLLFITGCDNNEGPFEIRMEQGNKILYSGEKPAKGWVKNTIYNFNKDASVVVYEIYFNNGVPDGDFRLYNEDGELVVDGKGKWNEKGFEGVIEEPLENGKGEGIFSINPNFLISFDGDDYFGFCYHTLTDGKYNGEKYKFEKINNKYNNRYLEYNFGGKLIYDIDYKDGKKDGKYLEYYENGEIKYDIDYKNGKKDGKYLEYEYRMHKAKLKYNIDYKDGKIDGKYLKYNPDSGDIVKDIDYKDGKIDGKYLEYTFNFNTAKFIVKCDIDYKDDIIDGKYLEYYSNGNLYLDIEYKNGKKNGKYLEYYENGKLYLKSVYKNDKEISYEYF